MRVGMCASGFGTEATPEFIRASAIAAERAGFATIWMGDHVVLFDDYSRSDYPYADFQGAGSVPFPEPRMPIVDPLIAMTWAAAATERIEVASGVIILPQRNPVVLANQLGSLDALCQGRVVLGAGLGWSREEYEAIGVPWSGRGRRMDEYLDALRALLTEDGASFSGETVSFAGAYVYPRPARAGGVPVIIGGESDAALRRVAARGDGWLSYKLAVADAAERIGRLRRLTEEAGRDPSGLRVVCTVFPHTSEDDLQRYHEAGVTDFNLMIAGSLPHSEPELNEAIDELASRFVEPVAGL